MDVGNRIKRKRIRSKRGMWGFGGSGYYVDSSGLIGFGYCSFNLNVSHAGC